MREKRVLNAALRPAKFLGHFLCYSLLNWLTNFSNIVLLWSGKIWDWCRVVPKMSLTFLLVKGCKFSLISQICHFLWKKQWTAINIELSFIKEIILFLTVWTINVGKQLRLNNVVGTEALTDLLICTFVSLIYTFSLAGHIIVHKPSQGKNRKSTYIANTSKSEWRLWWEINTFSVHLFRLMARAFNLSTEYGRT